MGESNSTTSEVTKKKPKGPIRFSLSLSDEQKRAKTEILRHPFNFILGKAGSGKTLLACQIALDILFKKEITQIIITRPTVSTEDNGFLPGNEKEKMEPWLVPIKSNMRKVYARKGEIDKLEQSGKIELVSLAHFRGRTFDDALVIVDEFQNLTRSQLRMAISRLGKNSKMIFAGDNQQIDLRVTSESAIHEISKIKDSGYVYKQVLEQNHRHEAIDDVLDLLNEV